MCVCVEPIRADCNRLNREAGHARCASTESPTPYTPNDAETCPTPLLDRGHLAGRCKLAVHTAWLQVCTPSAVSIPMPDAPADELLADTAVRFGAWLQRAVSMNR